MDNPFVKYLTCWLVYSILKNQGILSFWDEGFYTWKEDCGFYIFNLSVANVCEIGLGIKDREALPGKSPFAILDYILLA